MYIGITNFTHQLSTHFLKAYINNLSSNYENDGIHSISYQLVLTCDEHKICQHTNAGTNKCFLFVLVYREQINLISSYIDCSFLYGDGVDETLRVQNSCKYSPGFYNKILFTELT